MQGLTGELEKNSAVLGRSAVFQKTSRISKLPQYLTVQFVRFFWKKDSQKKAKILRVSIDLFHLRLGASSRSTLYDGQTECC
jgi:hypothetical protein